MYVDIVISNAFNLNKHFFLFFSFLVGTSLLLRCHYAFVIPILEYCFPVWWSAAECHLQLLELQVYSVARLCPDKTFLSLYHRRHVAACTVYVVQG